MPKVPRKRAVPVRSSIGAAGGAAADPAWRLDILLLRGGERLTRILEKRLAQAGVDVNLWDGADGVGAVVGEFCDAKGLTGWKATPAALAQRVGLLGRRRRAARRVKG